VASKACRELTVDEYRLIVAFAHRNIDFPLLVQFTYMTKFQIHFIARIDDVANVFAEELCVHPHFGFAFAVHLRWTKNCLDERQAPSLIVLGAMDSDFCVLIALGIYLQHILEFMNASRSALLFCDTNETPDNVKKQVSNIFKQRVLKAHSGQQCNEILKMMLERHQLV
jgi:hypothetical protein